MKPEAELGTVEGPGVRVMATADPAATELGAVPSTEVVMLEVCPMPKIVPRQLILTLTEAALAGVVRQKSVAIATGATTPARISVDAE
ncbi:hypothetical protein GCM10027088_38730 [Nocardia goodfellowii]